MSEVCSRIRVAIRVAIAVLALFLCAAASAHADRADELQQPLAITAATGVAGSGIAPSSFLQVRLKEHFTDESVRSQVEAAMAKEVANGWNCNDPENFAITLDGKPLAGSVTAHLKIYYAQNPGPRNCRDLYTSKGFPVFSIYIFENKYANLHGSMVLKFKNLSDPTLDIESAPIDVNWNPSVFTLGAQTILNENLNNSTIDKSGVEQGNITGTFPIPQASAGWGGLYLDTKDIFSTNERDKKSAFEGGAGVQIALDKRGFAPLKFEGQAQGNQVATNLSSVVLADLQLDAGFLKIAAANFPLRQPIAPTFELGLPYTHRYNQVVAAGAAPLPIDDFAVNPSLAFTGGEILHQWCKPASSGGTIPGNRVCLGWEADLGLWYLPLEKTSKGSERAEGYWDYSFLVPLTNFANIPFTTLDPQNLKTQLRIKYEDSVSPANNYARTKKWSFAFELIK
jgi:hypothetical protein